MVSSGSVVVLRLLSKVFPLSMKADFSLPPTAHVISRRVQSHLLSVSTLFLTLPQDLVWRVSMGDQVT